MVGKDRNEEIRTRLAWLLEKGGSHRSFESAVEGIPDELRGRRPEGVAHTAWQLIEHMRIAQRDVLDYCRDPDYASRDWPEEYWPETDGPPTTEAWDKSIRAFLDDRQALIDLVNRRETDLLKPIPWGEKGHDIFREALIVADHNGYHVGQLATLRAALGA